MKESVNPHTQFVTTTRGLDRDHPAMRLYEKAKKLGVWNPSEIDFSQDAVDWEALAADEQDLILRLTAMFVAGEEAVTLDLLPLMLAIAQEGRVEEEMFLTTFLFEEAKHTDFFRRFLDEVANQQNSLDHYHTPSYTSLFYEELPLHLNALMGNPSSENQIRASVTYNMIVEGMLAETGYHAFYKMLSENDIMPGMQKGIYLLKQDEARHIAYGIFLLSRLVSEDSSLWEPLEAHMNTLLYPGVGIIGEAFGAYEQMPFGLQEDDFVNYAMDQFQKRFARLEKAKEQSLREVFDFTLITIDSDDA